MFFVSTNLPLLFRVRIQKRIDRFTFFSVRAKERLEKKLTSTDFEEVQIARAWLQYGKIHQLESIFV